MEKVMAQEAVEVQEQVVEVEQVAAEGQQVEDEEEESATDDGDETVTVELTRWELQNLVRYQAGLIFETQESDTCLDCQLEVRLRAWERIGYFGSILGSEMVKAVMDDHALYLAEVLFSKRLREF